MKSLITLLAVLALTYSVAEAARWAEITYSDYLRDDRLSQSFRNGIIGGPMQATSTSKPKLNCSMSQTEVEAVLHGTPPIIAVHKLLAVAVLAAMQRRCDRR